MIDIEANQILIICSESDDEHGASMPFVKACPGQADVLKDFLRDLIDAGSRLAATRESLGKAKVLDEKFVREGDWRVVSREGVSPGVPVSTSSSSSSMLVSTISAVSQGDSDWSQENSKSFRSSPFSKDSQIVPSGTPSTPSLPVVSTYVGDEIQTKSFPSVLLTTSVNSKPPQRYKTTTTTTTTVLLRPSKVLGQDQGAYTSQLCSSQR